MNLDGSDVTLLFEREGQQRALGLPTGARSPSSAAMTVWRRTSSILTPRASARHAPPDPTLETHCGFAWSPDGKRLPCETYGVDDPNRNGIYSIRVSDGGGLTRITSNPDGGDIQRATTRRTGSASCSSGRRTTARRDSS